MKKIVLILLLCLCAGLLSVGCGGDAGGNGNPSLEDAMAVFYHNNIAVYPDQNAATLYTAAGADNATEFSVDNERIAIYEFGSEESLKSYMDSDDVSSYNLSTNGLLLIDTESERAQEIFSGVKEGDAGKWPITVTEAVLGEPYTSAETCEVTLEKAEFPLDVSDDVTLTPVEGKIYMGMSFKLANISEEEADLNDLIMASYNYDGYRYPGNARAYSEESEAWEYSMMLQPGETYDIRIFVIVPEAIITDEKPINAEISAGGKRFTYTIR